MTIGLAKPLPSENFGLFPVTSVSIEQTAASILIPFPYHWHITPPCKALHLAQILGVKIRERNRPVQSLEITHKRRLIILTVVNFRLFPKRFINTLRIPPLSHFKIHPCTKVSVKQEGTAWRTYAFTSVDIDNDLHVSRRGWSSHNTRRPLFHRWSIHTPDFRLTNGRCTGTVSNPRSVDCLFNKLFKIHTMCQP